MSKNQTQDAINLDNLKLVLEYAVSGKVDPKDVKKAKRTLRSTVTVQDVISLVTGLNQRNDQAISQLMDVVQVQSIVLKKLGATSEVIKEAQDEYSESLNEQREALEAARKQLEAQKEADKKAAE
jgi:hypothetical protein